MKQHEAKEFLPLIQAWADGKIIECNGLGAWRAFGLLDSIEFTLPPNRYRIKPPTPTLWAWKPEEVPVGALIRKDGLYPQVILGCDDIRVKCVWWEILYENLKHCQHSTDNGKTWHPCGVLE